ncbi:hypothetical protein FJSC11DRAFT_0277 [Fischerella thermalis JSC-11]|uniref:Uncharacterized protein n=1 Tax=Fischerella thermalis JSC-11 TaxID=741277 RepID=G6FN30_9CYAN|nr:hypothetical protein FJSC11DRAFT_0277 [Fischerella thermalis JSC-11]
MLKILAIKRDMNKQATEAKPLACFLLFAFPSDADL